MEKILSLNDSAGGGKNVRNLIKPLSIILFSFIAITVVANEITFEASGNVLTVKTRTTEYVFDTSSGVLKDVFFVFERRTHVYTYDRDGFDLAYLEQNLQPISYKTMSQINENGDAKLVFDYGNGIVKSITFINGPHYRLDVDVTPGASVLTLSLPRLSYDRNWEGAFFSYSPKKRVVVFDWAGQNVSVSENTLKIEGHVKLRGMIAPLKYTFLSTEFPHHYDRLKKVLKELPKARSWYDPIFYGLVAFMSWLYSWTKNFGWAIIIFTIVVRLILYPLYHAQMKSMVKMKELQPYIEKIRKKYKDPKAQQEALMKLYREKKVNPASGCLPLLIQLPIFFLLYAVIRYFGEEFAYGPRFLIWKDLSAGGFSQNIIFVLLSILLYFYSALITSQDKRTAWQSIIMSVIFPFLFMNLPSGLFLYYTMNALIQVLSTIYIYRKYNIKGLTLKELLDI
ncbi:MAG: YidC/Oxa1 family rane protein insertase [Thermotogota bacterium]|nr:YidC/Oxa1 family rane protein insertase [Thermotogota bacterium]